MNTRRVWTVIVMGLLFVASAGGARAQGDGPGGGAAAEVALGTGFTYQGRLRNGGSPVTGNCDIAFGLWNALSGGTQAGITQTVTAAVADGYFTTGLNGAGQFGPAAYNGQARWLALAARCPSGGGAFTPLSPRQPLLAAPYAQYAAGNWGLNGNAATTAAHFLGTTDNMTLTLAVSGTTALRLAPSSGAPNVLIGSGSNLLVPGVQAVTIGGGTDNVAAADFAHVGGGGQNIASHISANVSGGFDNRATGQDSTVGGGYDNQATGPTAVVAGGTGNRATGQGATVSGGGWDGTLIAGNQALGNASTIGGGISNTITSTADYATIGGGGGNQATLDYATVAGGGSNLANADSATVGGGFGNQAINHYATVNGGLFNFASGLQAAIGGGVNNLAIGQAATVGGGDSNRAQAPGATVGGGGWDGSAADGNQARGDASTIGGGLGNVITDTADYGTIAGGGSNTAAEDYATVGGGGSNTASADSATVSGGYGNTASNWYAAVGGGLFNFATGERATVGGGQANDATGLFSTVSGGYSNTASNTYAAIGGGDNNSALGARATIGGGYGNYAAGPGATVGGGGYDGVNAIGNQAFGDASTIGGGLTNLILSDGDYATVGGGYFNSILAAGGTIGGGSGNQLTGSYAAIGGGYGNSASGLSATIPGGYLNIASGDGSFAAGTRANALHDGSFVWSSANATPISSTTTNQFLVRATNGFSLSTNLAGTIGCSLIVGTWNCTSDRNAKANFAPVDGVAVLNTLASIPIETWNFNTQDAGIRHMGPMAQDWYAAFGLGEGDTTISAVDADGVALAAIQGLYAVVQEQAGRIAALEAQMAALQSAAGVETSPDETAHRTISTSAALPWALLAGLGLLNVGYVAGRRRASPRRH